VRLLSRQVPTRPYMATPRDVEAVS
jgi:hypothetical protein